MRFMLKRAVLSLFILLAVSSSSYSFLRGGSVVAPAIAPNTWATLKIGAGGYVTGMEVTGLKGDSADGLMVARTDTYGAYYWNGSAWVQCATISSMPAADVGYYDNQTTTPGNGGSLTIDATAGNGTAPTQQVGIGHVTATCTAAQCQYTGTNFAQASVIGESFH